MAQNVAVSQLTYKARKQPDGSIRPSRTVESVTLFYDPGETPQIDLLKLFKREGVEQVFSIRESVEATDDTPEEQA